MPSTTGPTASRWLGFAASVSRTSLPLGRLVLADRAEVVLHVARALRARGIELALELAEDLRVRLADDVGEHVEPAAVGHAEHDVAHARRRPARVQSASSMGTSVSAPSRLNRFCPRYLVCRKRSNASAALSRSRMRCFSADGDRWVRALDLLLDPLLLVGLLDVHVLDADGARVRVAQHAEDVAQRHDLAGQPAGAEVADRELAVEVPDREVVVRDVELGVGVGLAPPERVEVGDEVAAHPVHVDERVHLHDLLVLGVSGRRSRCGPRSSAPARTAPPGWRTRRRRSRPAEQQLVDAPQELAALGAGDDAVVVGVGERRDLAHRRAARARPGRRPRTRRGSRCCRRRR